MTKFDSENRYPILRVLVRTLAIVIFAKGILDALTGGVPASGYSTPNPDKIHSDGSTLKFRESARACLGKSMELNLNIQVDKFDSGLDRFRYGQLRGEYQWSKHWVSFPTSSPMESGGISQKVYDSEGFVYRQYSNSPKYLVWVSSPAPQERVQAAYVKRCLTEAANE